jgi:hypothetical protein
VNIPNPVGSQAPPAPDKSNMSPAEARRAAVADAFRKSRDPEWQKNRPGPAQATKGHNQPPEETPTERPKRSEPPINLKKRPDEQAMPGQGGRRRREREQQERGEGGRFAPRQAQQQPGGQAIPGRQGVYTPQSNPLPAQARWREPPPRMAEHAKAQWHAAPEAVRGEFARMHHEFSRAHQHYEQLKADHHALNTVRPYYDLARQQGTTLDRVLNNFTSIENKLRADPVGGLDLIVNNLNLQAQDGRRLGLRDIAWHVLNQTPEQLRLMQHNNAQASQAQQLAALRQQQHALAQQQQRMQYQQQFAATRSGVDRFAETHPRLDELGPVIERELKLGFSLEQAYQRACLLAPGGRAGQANRSNQSSAQQRLPDRSIHGAPSGGNGSARRPAKATGRPVSESLADAFRHVRGSL